MTNTNKTAAPQAKQDAQVLALKAAGATWKFIALEMGWGWNGANMDGGRAKRAYLRAVKAEVKVADVKLPQTLTKKLAAAQAAKVKAPAKPRTSKKAAAKPDFSVTDVRLNAAAKAQVKANGPAADVELAS